MAKRSKAAGKETHIGNLMVLKRHLQNLRSQVWQQEEWRHVSKTVGYVDIAFKKARGSAPREDKQRLDELKEILDVRNL